MNDEQYTPGLGSWLKETDVVPPDPQSSARQILAGLPERQKRRWWSPFRRSSAPVRTKQAATVATHANQGRLEQSHEITVTGRTGSMFSPFKAITAGVLALAVGGVVFLVQPFGEPREEAPGAVTDTVDAEILFVAVDEPNSGLGEFRSYGQIPSGTISRDAGLWEPPNFAFTITLDPEEPGGDTFAIQLSGQIQKQVADEVVQSMAFWNVVPGSGTGEYAGLSGKGRVAAVAHADNDFVTTDDWGVSVFVGTMDLPAE